MKIHEVKIKIKVSDETYNRLAADAYKKRRERECRRARRAYAAGGVLFAVSALLFVAVWFIPPRQGAWCFFASLIMAFVAAVVWFSAWRLKYDVKNAEPWTPIDYFYP